MIYTLGCSFTKWHWHTWADWLAEYSSESVTNLGWPGFSNQAIYWELLSRKDQLSSGDTVYIMLTGNNRSSCWYDSEWIARHDCKGFFPDANGQLEFSNEPWRGLYRTHPSYELSLTHMIVDNFNTVYQIQQLLNSTGCQYRMMFWQNPWYDVRPELEPTWKWLWPSKQGLTNKDLRTAQSILKLTPVNNLLNSIDWHRFYMAPTDSADPTTYNGMWEYKNNLQKQAEYLEYAHDDPHPDALVQHDFLTNIVLNTPGTLRERAKELALVSKQHMVNYDRASLVQPDVSCAWPKFYKDTDV